MGEFIRILAAFNIQILQVCHIIVEELIPYLSLILFISFIMTAALWIDQYYRHWTRRGVKQEYTYLFTDDMTKKLLRKRPFCDMLTDIYNRFSGTRYVGFYQFHKPILMLKDPELIESVCKRENCFFQDHTTILHPNCDPLWSKSMFALKGDKWLRAREQIKPLFLERHMRNMYAITKAYAYEFTNSLVPLQRNVLETDCKELFAKFSTELTSRVVYDLRNNSFRNMNSMFYTKLRESQEDFGTGKLIKVLLGQTFPFLGKVLKARIFSEPLCDFFTQITTKIMRHRERFGIENLDLISLLMNARNREVSRQLLRVIGKYDPGASISNESIERDMTEAGIDLSEDTIIAQAMTFFYAGYDVISTVLSFLFYELALNPSVQRKLLKDLDLLRSLGNDDDTYRDLFGLPYLSMVISETLRKWPPIYFTERCCNVPCVIHSQMANEFEVPLSAGDSVWIPIWAIHRDPKYWWKPEVFDPERFAPKKMPTIQKCSFLPFGFGPRRCVATSYSVMQIKIAVCEILTLFEVVPIKRTPESVVLDHRSFHLAPRDGLWLGFKRRFM